jgi:hypothetical protein
VKNMPTTLAAHEHPIMKRRLGEVEDMQGGPDILYTPEGKGEGIWALRNFEKT